MKSKNIKKIIIFLMLIIIAFLICYQSTTNPFVKQSLGKDSSVFIYVAKAMKNGQLPYKDVFDHKGPLLYFIDYIGILFSNNSYIGIWIIEIIFMTIDLIYMYKISKLLVKNDVFAILAVLIAIIPLTSYWQEGNLTEEYALPFIIVSLYYMTKYIVNKKDIKRIESFIMGACMSFVLLLRPNMISMWIVYCILIFIDMMINKKYREAIRTIIFFILGMVTILSICAIALLVNGILMECIKEYISFNFRYIQKPEISFLKNMRIFLSYSIIMLLCIVICIISTIYKIIKKEKNILLPISSLLYIILTFAIIIIPQRPYLHYAIILLPTYIIPLSIYFKFLESKKDKYFLVALSVAWILLFTKNNHILAKAVYKNLHNTTQLNEYIVSTIKERTDVNDKILVIGNRSVLYLESERQADSKYIYQFPIINVDKHIKEEVEDNLKNIYAKLLIYDKNQIKGTDIQPIIDNLLNSNRYNKIQEINSYIILERN